MCTYIIYEVILEMLRLTVVDVMLYVLSQGAVGVLFYSKLSSFSKKMFYFAAINGPIISPLFYGLFSKMELENWILII